MALFKKNRLPDLPNPPSKFSDISDDNMEEDFPSYTPAVDFNSKIEQRSKGNQMGMPNFSKEEVEEHYEKKPLFIKIDKYEDAISVLNAIKEKLDEAGNIVSELRQIRKDEDTQLDEWSENIKAIKDKLMNVDDILFE